MGDLGLAEKVVVLHQTLHRAGIPHAFGGALALAYYAEPRATVDIDVNVFVAPERYGEVLALLQPLGIDRVPSEETVARAGQGRLWWGRTPLDLFFSCDDVHEAMRRHTRIVPFGDDRIPVLAPEHLLLAKAVFDRPKDWLDIKDMLVAVRSLDLDEVNRWLAHLLDAEDPRATRLRALVADVLGR